MGLYRLYTGGDGESHIEDLKLADHPELLKLQPTTGIQFREWPKGEFIDWHPAPRRQWVIILSGQLEIGLGDGTSRRFGAGDARLVEDTTGRGHTTRVVGDQLCITATVPVAS
jgi:quercetin dioxygenase-like cupin family protein